MPKSGSNRSTRPTLRNPDVRQRLERARERTRERRQQARHREQVITGAVKQYIAAWDAITACQIARDRDVEALQQQIIAVQARAAEQIAEHQARQAYAAATIRDQGQTDHDVADLLEITPKQARQLINAARATTDGDTSDHRPPLSAGRTSQPVETGPDPRPSSRSAVTSGRADVDDSAGSPG